MMDNIEESSVSECSVVKNQVNCDNLSSSPMGVEYDLQQSNVALLKAELKLVTQDRDLLRKELSKFQTHGPTTPFPFTSVPLAHPTYSQTPSSSRDYDALQRQCDAAMTELQSLKRQHDRCEKAAQESEYYRGQHRSVLSKLDSTTQEMHTLIAKYGEVLTGKQRLEQEVHSLSQAREEDRKEINELRRQQQETVVKGNGTNETLNQLYVTTLRKYEAIKDEHDSLRKRYADLVASHSAAVSKLELAQEEMTRLKKEYDESIQERNGAVRERNVLKSQCTHAIMQWDIAIRERNTYFDFLTKIQLQHEEEINKGMAVRIKSSKDLKRLTEERNAAMEEYSLVMRERDSVHKEIEKLQDDLLQSNQKLKTLEAKINEFHDEKKLLLCQVESLRREIKSALDDRDTALKELHDMHESDEYQVPRWKESSHDDQERKNRFGISNGCLINEQLRKDRLESQKSFRGESYSSDGGEQEVEQFKKQLEKLQSELIEVLQEAEVSKQRRDWAFGERDKIVLERESIRTLCDRLRRERDRAVSDLAEALRDSDDVKRQRNEIVKELKDLKEKLGEIQLEKEKEKEKENRAPLNHSYDSALGTDFSDMECETIEVELDWSGCMMDLGFSLAGGKTRPIYHNDYGLYVVSVTQGGPGDGKLKVNDCLVKVGTLSCTAADSDSVMNLLRSTKMPVGLTVKRRRFLYQGLYSVKLPLQNDISHGFSLETGIFIRSIVSGSNVARKTLLKPGDRLCNVNGRILDSSTSLVEVIRMLNDSFGQNDEPTISVLRGSPTSSLFPVSLPSLGSPSCSSSVNNVTEEDSSIDCNSRNKIDSHFSIGRRHGSKHSKNSPTSSNAPSNGSSAGSIASAGLVVWDMFRETLSRTKRAQNKDKSSHIEDGKGSMRTSMESPAIKTLSPEREAAAIAVLEDVIDRFNPVTSNSNSDDATNLGTHKKKFEIGQGLVTLSRRKRVMGNSKSECKREEARMSSGGTWPRSRGAPFVSGEYLDGANTLFHSYKYPRARLPLSVFIDSSKTSKNEEVVEFTTDDDKDLGQTAPSGDYRPYEGRTSIETVDPASDGSIDLSVQSGNLGKEDLGRYLKKKGNTSCGTVGKADADTDIGRSSQLSLTSNPQTLTSVNGVLSGGGPIHIHSALQSGLPTHLRIQSQLYPAAIHSSLKYKVSPHVSHMHAHPHNLSPPLYSPPPPLPRPPTENPYNFPLGTPHSLLLTKSYNHSQSPSIDSAYSRPHSHTHNHMNVAAPFGFEPNRSTHTEYVQLPFTESLASKKEPARIRIPSNPSVTSRNSIGRMSTSSVERLSEQESPMPNFHVEILSPGRPGTGLGSRSSVEEYSWTTRSGSKFKPAPDELRRVYIEKSSEPLGIQIFCRNSGGVFVSSVHQSSLAAQVGLQVGDQLLEVCGINMRSATYQLAACVLHQCGNSITMLVQYNPTKYQELQEMTSMGLIGEPSITSSSSEFDGNGPRPRSSNSRSGSPTPCNSPRHSRDHSNASGNGCNQKPEPLDVGASALRNALQYDRLIDRGSEIRSSTIVRPPSTHGTLTRHHGLATLKRPTSMITSGSVVDDNPASCREREPRLVYFEMKKAHSLGISLVGGNAVGIFVHSVQNDSPAFKAGLRCGDRILEFNGVNLRESTAEQAAYELAKPAEQLTLIVQYDIERYQEIAEQPGDSFYVRAQFDKLAFDCHEQMELCFRRDDVLHIDNTMFNGVPGLWRAWLVDSDGRKIRCGVIPSKYKIEEDLLQRSSLADLDHESRRASTSARRSFFRRRKHTRSSSRDSKEIASFSDASIQPGSSEGLGLTASVCLPDSTPVRPVSYAQVERYDCKEIRPVIIVGPLSDCVVDKLVQEFPRKFIRVLPELMPYSESYMEAQLEENNFVEYRRKGTHYECITIAAVQNVCEKNLHGLLDISLNAVSRLHNRRCFPIIILLKFKSLKHVREVKDTRLPSDKITAKAVKEMYEHVIKIETEYRQLISAVVPAGGNLACLCTQVSAAVDQEQGKILWVPQGSIW